MSNGNSSSTPSTGAVPEGMREALEQIDDWLIWHDPLPIEWRGADWRYCRKDARDEFDTGTAESREMALQCIDFIEQDEVERASPEGVAREEREAARSYDRMKQLLLIHQMGQALKAAKSVIATNGRGSLDSAHISTIDAALAAFTEQHA